MAERADIDSWSFSEGKEDSVDIIKPKKFERDICLHSHTVRFPPKRPTPPNPGGGWVDHFPTHHSTFINFGGLDFGLGDFLKFFREK